MTFIEELLKFVKDENKFLTKNIQGCMEEINTSSNLFKSELQNFKDVRTEYNFEEDSKIKCVKYLVLIHQSLVDQSQKL